MQGLTAGRSRYFLKHIFLALLTHQDTSILNPYFFLKKTYTDPLRLGAPKKAGGAMSALSVPGRQRLHHERSHQAEARRRRTPPHKVRDEDVRGLGGRVDQQLCRRREQLIMY